MGKKGTQRRRSRSRPSPAAPQAAARRDIPAWKQALFSLLALVLFFGAVETTLWLAGVETRLQRDDPFRGFSALVRVFEQEGDRWRTRPSRMNRVFNQQSFAASKPERGLRIFGLGGSSAYGYPWGADAAFLSILGDAIANAYPERPVEAVNVGGMSYAMHRLRIVANEIVDYQPDVLVIYSGHNEFVEPAFYDALKRRRPSWNRIEAFLSQSRLYSLMHRVLAERPDQRRALAEDFDTYVRRDNSVTYSSSEKHEIVAGYRTNLRHVVRLAQERGVKVLLATVPCNLRDWQPEESIVETDLDDAASAKWADALARGRGALDAGRYGDAVTSLRAALALVPEHAQSHYLLAKAYEGLEEWRQARAAYQRAADQDASPIRRLSRVNDAVRDVAREEGALLVDVERIFEELSEHGLIGLNLIEDYVHPTREAHRIIAWHMWRAIDEAGWLGDPGRASRASFDEMLARRPQRVDTAETPVWLSNQARVLANQGKDAEAIAKLREAVRLRPDYVMALYNLGVLLSRSGHPAEGERHLRQVLAVDPRSFQGHNALGTTLRRLDRPEDAVEAFRKALELKPDFAFAWNNLGAAYVDLERYPEAVAAIRKALEVNPHHAGFRTNLGNVLLEAGQIEAALGELREAAQAAPDSFVAQDGFARALLDAGDFATAEQHLRAALRLDPDAAQTHRRLGVALVAQGRVDEGVRHLRRAVALAPDDPEARRQLDEALARAAH